MGPPCASLHLTAYLAFCCGSFVLDSEYAEKFTAQHIYKLKGTEEGLLNKPISTILNADSIKMDSFFSTVDSFFTTIDAFTHPSTEHQDVPVNYDSNGTGGCVIA